MLRDVLYQPINLSSMVCSSRRAFRFFGWGPVPGLIYLGLFIRASVTELPFLHLQGVRSGRSMRMRDAADFAETVPHGARARVI